MNWSPLLPKGEQRLPNVRNFGLLLFFLFDTIFLHSFFFFCLATYIFLKRDYGTPNRHNQIFMYFIDRNLLTVTKFPEHYDF